MFRIYAESIRIRDWWNFIIPPIIGFYLWGLCQAGSAFTPTLLQTAGFIVLAVAVASFGFFLNEWTDMEDDRLAGKTNRVSGLNRMTRLGFFLFILLQIAAGTYYAVTSLHAGLLLAIQLLLLLLYSCPPFRLKNHLYLAPLVDALYSGTVFYLLAINISYARFFTLSLTQKTALCMLFLWAMVRGFRNIILHLLEDARFDQALALETIGTQFDLSRTRNFLRTVLLPAEVISFCLFAFIGLQPSGFLLGAAYLLFVFYCLNRDRYIIPFLVRRKTPLPANSVYDINTFQEVILPLLLGLYLVIVVDPLYVILLVFLLAVFRNIRHWVTRIFVLPFQYFRS